MPHVYVLVLAPFQRVGKWKIDCIVRLWRGDARYRKEMLSRRFSAIEWNECRPNMPFVCVCVCVCVRARVRVRVVQTLCTDIM